MLISAHSRTSWRARRSTRQAPAEEPGEFACSSRPGRGPARERGDEREQRGAPRRARPTMEASGKSRCSRRGARRRRRRARRSPPLKAMTTASRRSPATRSVRASRLRASSLAGAAKRQELRDASADAVARAISARSARNANHVGGNQHEHVGRVQPDHPRHHGRRAPVHEHFPVRGQVAQVKPDQSSSP